MEDPSVHICNLANVAYSNCKILSEKGDSVRLLTHDIAHVMSQPEWQDLDLNPSDFKDEWDFYGSIDRAASCLKGYNRPEWYFDSCIFDPGVVEDAEFGQQVPLTQRFAGSSLIQARKVAKKVISKFPSSLQSIDKVYGTLKRWGVSRRALEAELMAQLPRSRSEKVVNRLNDLIARTGDFGREWSVDLIDLLPYEKQAMWLNQHQIGSRTVFGYVTTAIYPMILHDVPVVAVEIGTIRDLPFEGTAYARTVAMMYREADHVLITNPDTVAAAERLGIENYSFCPHPVDESIYCPVEEEQKIKKANEPVIIFAPARQNWSEKGNDKLYRAFAEVLRRGYKMELHVPAWGQDVERGRRLVKSLGISDLVKWLAPQSERRLIRSYQEADVVADQFVHGVFGLISPKAMACGCPVITSYRRDLNSWCFPEDPPLFPATEEKEIVNQLELLAGDPGLRQRAGIAARRWVEKYHSKSAVYSSLKGAESAAEAAAEQRRSNT